MSIVNTLLVQQNYVGIGCTKPGQMKERENNNNNKTTRTYQHTSFIYHMYIIVPLVKRLTRFARTKKKRAQKWQKQGLVCE